MQANRHRLQTIVSGQIDEANRLIVLTMCSANNSREQSARNVQRAQTALVVRMLLKTKHPYALVSLLSLWQSRRYVKSCYCITAFIC
jgi:hypothetical protein